MARGSMTGAELLAANGGRWKVRCYSDGNRRRLVRTVYVKALDVLTAECKAREQSGCRIVDARIWDPRYDRCVTGFFRESPCE